MSKKLILIIFILEKKLNGYWNLVSIFFLYFFFTYLLLGYSLQLVSTPVFIIGSNFVHIICSSIFVDVLQFKLYTYFIPYKTCLFYITLLLTMMIILEIIISYTVAIERPQLLGTFKWISSTVSYPIFSDSTTYSPL